VLAADRVRGFDSRAAAYAWEERCDLAMKAIEEALFDVADRIEREDAR
jgi:hypothetical protein